jgi:hypothetical protein
MTRTYGYCEETHTYTIDGVSVPFPTRVLQDQLPYRGAVAGSDFYMGRGKAVHACAAMIARGEEFDLPDDENREYMEGCCASIWRFFAEVKPCVIHAEVRRYSDRYRFAGTVDLLAMMNGVRYVMDWKSAFTSALPYQLGAYGILTDCRYGYGVQYSPDGQYKMSERYDLRQYGTAFLSLLGAYNIRAKEGYTSKEE